MVAGRMSDRLLCADEIAELLAVPVSWVREHTRSDGELPLLYCVTHDQRSLKRRANVARPRSEGRACPHSTCRTWERQTCEKWRRPEAALIAARVGREAPGQ